MKPADATEMTAEKSASPESAKQRPRAASDMEPEFDLEAFLPYQLSILSNTVSQGIAHIYQQDYDLSVVEWRIIAVLGRYPGITASQLVERTVMDKVAVSRAIKRLQQRRLVERQPDPRDRRCRRLRVTADRGQEVLDRIAPRARNYERALLRGISRAERRELLRLMSALQDAAVRMNGGEGVTLKPAPPPADQFTTRSAAKG